MAGASNPFRKRLHPDYTARLSTTGWRPGAIAEPVDSGFMCDQALYRRQAQLS